MEKLRAVFRKRILRATSFMICFILMSFQNSPSKEYQVKAMFLYNFAQFVEWPSTSFKMSNDPIVIGILGKDKFGKFLDNTVENESIGNHLIIIKRYDDIDQIKDCHILFINSDQDELEELMPSLHQKSILTVGESKDFIKSGGMIRLYLKNGKIRIQINVNEAKKAQLKISSKLLKVSEIV